MNIIKELKGVGTWKSQNITIDWGLGNDNLLYYKWHSDEADIEGTNEPWYKVWSPYNSGSDFGITLKDMKQIVKAFGHLMIWS
jgi:hypothetical protein